MFIYAKEKALSSEICQSFISSFENSKHLQSKGKVSFKENNKSFSEPIDDIKSSTEISFSPEFLTEPELSKTWEYSLNPLIKILNKGHENYRSRYFYPSDSVIPLEISPSFNLQRYYPNEGYKALHCENAGYHPWRCLAWMVYLNDITDNGETEFFHQKHFEVPKEGKLVIWPADWTYIHRGITSPSQTKYILTGWYEFVGVDKKIHYFTEKHNI